MRMISETTMTRPATTSESASGSDDFRPIADYALLADCNSAALVNRAGSVDWLCMPRYDSDAIFARILDPGAGHWSIRPVGSFSAERRYLPGTLVLETTFTTEDGTVRLLDAMAFAHGQRGHELGYDAPHELLRSVEGVSGEVELELALAPRPEYGLIRPLIRLEDGEARTFGASRVGLSSDVLLAVDEESTIHASFTVSAGASLGFALRWAAPEQRKPPAPTPAGQTSDRIADVAEAWRSWEAEHDIYEGASKELVHRQSQMLRASAAREVDIAALTLGLCRARERPPRRGVVGALNFECARRTGARPVDD
jgi:GH15 family glucan-1,4-alpha-glucosidase